MPDTELYKKREVYKLIIARDSINSALEAVETAISLGVDHNHPLFTPLFHAVVSSYGRPFTEMKPFGVLSTKWARFEDETLQAEHDMLMNHRDKNVAHTDYIDEKVVLYPPNFERRDGSSSPGLSFEVLTQYYAPNAYPHIRNLCNDLAGRLQTAINKQLADIYGDGSGLGEQVELITRDDIESLGTS